MSDLLDSGYFGGVSAKEVEEAHKHAVEALCCCGISIEDKGSIQKWIDEDMYRIAVMYMREDK